MINQADRYLLEQEMKEERFQEEQEEARLHSDEEYCFEQVVDEDLMEIYETLVSLATKMNRYGWTVGATDLLNRLKNDL